MLRTAVPICVGLLFAIAGVAAEDPQTTVQPRLDEGRNLYRDYCEACHGETGTAGASGDIRGLGFSNVANALDGTEQMPAFDFSDAEIGAIVAYIDAL